MGRGEAVALLGDFKRAIDNPKETHGKKLLIEWLQDNMLTLLNGNIHTRIAPNKYENDSILDLVIVSNNILKCVESFQVDSDKVITPFYKLKKGQNQYTDHRPILVKLVMPSLKINTNKLRRPIINFRNMSGWDNYKEISDKHAYKIIDAISNITDVDKLERKIYGIDLDIQLEYFGVTWEKAFKKKKVRNKTSKELTEIYKQRHNELEEVLSYDFFKQDLYQRIFQT